MQNEKESGSGSGSRVEEIDKLQQELKATIKEKEAMVVRFAVSERNGYKQKVVNERLQKQLNQVVKEFQEFKVKTNNSTNINNGVGVNSNNNDMPTIINNDIAEVKASLILIKHQKGTLELKVKSLLDELSSYQMNFNKIQEEIAKLRTKLHNVENERDCLLEDNSRLQRKISEQSQCFDELHIMKQTLLKQQDCIENQNEQLNDLKLSNIDFNETNCNLMEREREFADFVTKVIDENCHFKVNYRFFENKIQQQNFELRSLRRCLDEYQERMMAVKDDLNMNVEDLQQSNERLKKKLTEINEQNCHLRQEFEECCDRNVILERRLHILESSKRESMKTQWALTSNKAKNDTFLEAVIKNESVDKSLIAIIGKLQTSSIEKSEKIDFLQDQIKVLSERLIKLKRKH